MKIVKMSKQDHHTIGEVYLSPFSFTYKDGPEQIYVLEKGMDRTARKNIRSFMAPPNQFDLQFFSATEKGVFEDLNGKVETHYPKVLAGLKGSNQLNKENEFILKQFVSNLLCRTSNMRKIIQSAYDNPAKRDAFLNEISMYTKPELKGASLVGSIPAEDRLNFLSLLVMRHLTFVFEHFSCVIIREYDKRGWITCDNPVVVDYNGVIDYLIPIETEIYFPLSPEYCLYMHHPNSEIKTNELRKLPNGRVCDASESVQEMIFAKIRDNVDKYVIFPWNLGVVDLSKL